MRRNHLLGEDEICGLWLDENRKLYGDDLEMTEEYRWGWTHIPHFVHTPFYCYGYIFGCLLSLTLHEKLREEGEDIKEQILQLFRAGSSRSPVEVLTEMGINPEQKACWEKAFRYFEELIISLEAI